MTSAPALTSVPWELAIQRAWRKVALTFASALSVATVFWQLEYPNLFYDFVFRADSISAESAEARQALLPLVALTAVVALLLSLRLLKQALQGKTAWPVHRELWVTSLVGLSLLGTPTVEFDHPVFTALVVAILALALANAASKELKAMPAVELSPRHAWFAVGFAVFLFVSVMGFIAHWRYITFHAEVCDTSWEVGAIAGILRHGVPTVSVGAWMYEGKPLPQPYFNNHVPFIHYLFVPFFALYRDARTLLWVQAAFMGSGAVGAHLIGRRWFGSQLGGVLLAWLYVLNPSVQSFCLHDIHANVLVVPVLTLAVGLMEAGRAKTAAGFALLAAVCREEAPLYAAGLGLYWMFGGEDRRRFRIGLGTLVGSIGLELFFSSYLMPRFGGKPRWEHFGLFFDSTQSASSLLKALVLNPLGAAFSSMTDLKFDYLAISLVPLGGLALRGWQATWLALPAFLLLVPSSQPGFFCLGMNYSAPLVPAALIMGFSGLSRVWNAHQAAARERVGVIAYVLASAVLANYLYGNIASKSYKLEYGYAPLRRENQRDFREVLGYVHALPPFGPMQKALWQVIERVPKNAAVLTSWAINPQLSDRDVSLVFSYSGGNPAPEERVDHVVIDKLPALQTATEPDLLRFRDNPNWKLVYENQAGVIFQRKR